MREEEPRGEGVETTAWHFRSRLGCRIRAWTPR